MEPEKDRYEAVRSIIEEIPEDKVPVPYLARLIDVRAPTLTAKLRNKKGANESKPVNGGKTSYVPKRVALDWAKTHKYAILGWPTAREAESMTGIKFKTITARHEAGKLEGHVDLTKKLRVNPEEVRRIRLAPRGYENNLPRPHPTPNPLPTPTPAPLPAPTPSQNLKPHVVKFITRKDYGLPETPLFAKPNPIQTLSTNNNHPQETDELRYNPADKPRASECVQGRRVKYRGYEGIIKGVIADEFSPVVVVDFGKDKEADLQGKIHLSIRRKSE